MFTGIVVFTIVVAIGTLVWAVLTGEGSVGSSGTDVDEGDVSLLSAGMQDPALGVTAYTVGKACSQCNGHDIGDCQGSLPKNLSDTAVDLSTPNVPLADDDSAEFERFVDDPEPPRRLGLVDVGTEVITSDNAEKQKK